MQFDMDHFISNSNFVPHSRKYLSFSVYRL